MRAFKSEHVEGKILERIDEINKSFPNKKTSPKFRLHFAAKQADTLYKHIPDYAKVKFGKRTKVEDYVVNAAVWQEFLVRKWFDKIDLEQIKPTERSSDLFRVDRQTGSKGKTENEKIQCRRLLYSGIDSMGKLYDFQVPLKARKREKTTNEEEHKGELDIVAREGDEMVIIEYKIPDSLEPLLRAVFEVITYYFQIDGENAESKYLKSFNDTFFKEEALRNRCKKIGMAIVVPEVAYRFGHDCAFALIQKYNIKCYKFKGEKYKEIERLTNDEIEAFRREAKNHLEGIYKYSQTICDNMKLV